MCGRYVITAPDDAMADLFEAMPGNDLPPTPNYNVCPTDPVAVVTSEGDTRRLRTMRWGFLPHWYKSPTDGPLLINARAETLIKKPAFQGAARQRRAIIPATGFYEWTKAEDGSRLPWYIHRADAAPLGFAAVWQDWARGEDQITTCAIVTTASEGPMADIHHRMPVVLEPEDWALWLGEAGHGAAALMRAAAPESLRFHRVDPAVNSNRAAGPELIEPIAA